MKPTKEGHAIDGVHFSVAIGSKAKEQQERKRKRWR